MVTRYCKPLFRRKLPTICSPVYPIQRGRFVWAVNIRRSSLTGCSSSPAVSNPYSCEYFSRVFECRGCFIGPMASSLCRQSRVGGRRRLARIVVVNTASGARNSMRVADSFSASGIGVDSMMPWYAMTYPSANATLMYRGVPHPGIGVGGWLFWCNAE